MEMLKRAFATMLIFSVAILLFGCGNVQPKTIKLGLTPAVDAIPFIIAQDNGYFKKRGIEVELQVFKSAKDRDTAFLSTDLDGVLCDLVAICIYNNSGTSVKITGITDGDFMLIAGAQSGIKSMQDLKGSKKKVAISEKTVIDFTLDKLLEKNSLSGNDIMKEMIPSIPTRLEMLRNNKVQLALLPEPYSSLAIKSGGVKIDSAYNSGIFSNVSSFKQKTLDEKGEAVNELYEAYVEALEYIKTTPVEKYEDRIIDFIGYPKDMKGQIILPQYRDNALPDVASIEAAVRWSLDKGIIKKELDAGELVYDLQNKK